MILDSHKLFLEKISQRLKKDERILGVGVGGSYITQDMDEFSDLDLVIAIHPDHYNDIMDSRVDIANSMGNMLSAFTGEHVGEPRVIISLYDERGFLIHVDYKFVSLDDISNRVEDPIILWQRDECITKQFSKSEAHFPMPSMQWIEDRFWVWVHYGTLKIGRGELFETIEFISFLRQNVIGPMLLIKNNKLPKGVRKIETDAPDHINELTETIATHNLQSCIVSLENIIKLYIKLRENLFSDDIVIKTMAQAKTLLYFEEIKAKVI